MCILRNLSSLKNKSIQLQGLTFNGRDLKVVQQNTSDSGQTILEWYEALSPEDMAKEMDDKPLIY